MNFDIKYIAMTSVKLDDEAFIRQVDHRLREYKSQRHDNKHDPFDELLFIILSAQTEYYSYHQTWNALRRQFPTRQALAEARISQIAGAIRAGGLAEKKARQIKGAIQKIIRDTGKISLSFLKNLDNAEVEKYLMTLPGIGVKSARCIMMYSLSRQVFPVDTHVWRVSRRLGLAPPIPKSIPALATQLEELIPHDLRYTLHVNMVSHGRAICTTYWPKCDQCMLNDICPSAFKPDNIWGEWRKPQGHWKNFRTNNRRTR